MILAKINDPNLIKLLPGEVWSEALDWIREKSATADFGIHDLRGDLMYVNVCRMKLSHEKIVDLKVTENISTSNIL